MKTKPKYRQWPKIAQGQKLSITKPLYRSSFVRAFDQLSVHLLEWTRNWSTSFKTKGWFYFNFSKNLGIPKWYWNSFLNGLQNPLCILKWIWLAPDILLDSKFENSNIVSCLRLSFCQKVFPSRNKAMNLGHVKAFLHAGKWAWIFGTKPNFCCSWREEEESYMGQLIFWSCIHIFRYYNI